MGAPLLPGPPQAQVKIKHQLCAYASSLLVGAVGAAGPTLARSSQWSPLRIT